MDKVVGISVDGKEAIEVPFHQFLSLLTNASLGARDSFSRTYDNWKKKHITDDAYVFFLSLTRHNGETNEIAESLPILEDNLAHSNNIVNLAHDIETHLKK